MTTKTTSQIPALLKKQIADLQKTLDLYNKEVESRKKELRDAQIGSTSITPSKRIKSIVSKIMRQGDGSIGGYQDRRADGTVRMKLHCLDVNVPTKTYERLKAALAVVPEVIDVRHEVATMNYHTGYKNKYKRVIIVYSSPKRIIK